MDRGVEIEDTVAIHLPPSVELIWSILGVLGAGAAYVPLDPAHPVERLAHMIRETETRLVIGREVDRARFVDMGVDLVPCDERGRDGPGYRRSRRAPSELNLAYVIYTSGSTGAPKGVMVTHEAAYNYVEWREIDGELTSDDRVVLSFPVTADPSVWEIFAPLSLGGRLIVAEPGGGFDAEYIASLVLETGATALQVVPPTLRLLVDNRLIERCKTLRHVYCGGEALPAKIARGFASQTDARLHNIWGTTETTIGSTDWICGSDLGRDHAPIGREIGNTRVAVLDDDFVPVAVGEAGELYVGGVGVARGYVANAAATAERFVPSVLDSRPGERMYRTGDRARRFDGGAFEFLGRIDDQIKLRGHRIEPAEVEAALRRHADVRDAAVVVLRDDRDDDGRLIAYVVSVPDAEPRSADLRQFLSSLLPRYMIPLEFLSLDRLPLRPNGKVDRAALARGVSTAQVGAMHVGEAVTVEDVVRSFWAELLHEQPASSSDDFFDCGGDSLLATRLATRIRERFDVDLSIRFIFDHSTLAELVSAVEAEVAPPAAATSSLR